MPAAPRRPSSPTAPAAPARPRLARFRTDRSVALDGAEVKPRGEELQPIPPFVRWPHFHQFLDEHWEAGEHLSIVAQTGFGKTTLVRRIIDVRDYTIIIANKREDDSLYPPMNPELEELGFEVTNEFNPNDLDRPRLIFYCPLEGSTKRDEDNQREQLRTVLRQLYLSRGWCVVLDEVAYLSKDLKLDRELNALWREGRSAGTTVVAGTQRPVNVPRNMWEMATHVIGFKITGREDRATASEYLGDYQGVAFETFKLLDRYEFLYIDALDSIAMRSRVELTKR